MLPVSLDPGAARKGKRGVGGQQNLGRLRGKERVWQRVGVERQWAQDRLALFVAISYWRTEEKFYQRHVKAEN